MIVVHIKNFCSNPSKSVDIWVVLPQLYQISTNNKSIIGDRYWSDEISSRNLLQLVPTAV